MRIAGCDQGETPEEGKLRVLEQAGDYKCGNGGRKHAGEKEEGNRGEEGEAAAEIEDRKKAAVVMASRCSNTSGGCDQARRNAGIESRDKRPRWRQSQQYGE